MTLRPLLSKSPAIILLMTLAWSACSDGGGGSASPGSPSPSSGSGLTGAWVGNASDSSGPGQMTWQLTQSGGSFTGSITMTDTATKLSGRGSISGTMSGSSLRFTIAVPSGGFDAPHSSCTADVSGDGELNGAAINGTYQGTSSCGGTISSGQMLLNRQ